MIAELQIRLDAVGRSERQLPEITVPDIHFDAGTSTTGEVSEAGDILLDEVEEGPPGPVHVLFVGNSYTSVNDLPSLLTALAKSLGQTIETGAHIPGGYRSPDAIAGAVR